VQVTHNSWLTAKPDPLVIQKASPLFATLIKLGKGDRVKVSGHFIAIGGDVAKWKQQYCFIEGSFTIDGGMREPEYWFLFSAVELN
jgi:hypothetical protein